MLQSKNVKLVAARSGPSLTRTDSLLVKWDSPSGIAGSRSFLKRGWRNLLLDNIMIGLCEDDGKSAA